ncbi:MAG: hypothetical protein EHM59_17380 [Betaproteobacteria bacterium]|nr:MAG: hypothetical protein EHM59_17380 [Betaproteobacteria bacterium]
MNTPRTTWMAPGLLGAALLLLCTAPVTWAQSKSDDKLLHRYGGVLAPECGNYLLPQLLYLGDSLVVREGGKAILTGRNAKAAPTHFGATPPPEFEAAFTSEVAGSGAMVFVFYRNASGLFAVVEGGPKVMAAVPAALKGRRVRHCDPNRSVAPGTKPPVEIGPTDLLRDEKFKRSYVQALGPLAKEPWLMELDGPAQLVKKVQVAGNEYQLASVCKNHDCYDNNMVLLYAAASQTVYGKVVQRGRAVLVGAPPAPVAAELERLWKATYRSGK